MLGLVEGVLQRNGLGEGWLGREKGDSVRDDDGNNKNGRG